MRKAIRGVLAATLGVVVWAGGAPTAAAATVESVQIDARLTREGVLTVTETLTLPADFDGSITQTIPTRLDRDGERYTYTISDLTVTAGGTAVTPTQRRSAGTLRLTFQPGTATEVVVAYTVAGTTLAAPDNKIDFTWTLLGGLSTGASAITGRVEFPPGAVNYACQAGTAGALTNCSTYSAGTHGDTGLEFSQSALGDKQVLQAGALFGGGAVTVTEQVAPIWTLGRALTPGSTQIGLMVLVGIVGALLLFSVWRRLRAAGYRGVPRRVAGFVTGDDGCQRFEADGAVRPGLVGTLVDGRADPADIVATLLDLAVRGHLRITELPRARYATADWAFTRLTPPDELKPYERALLDALTPGEITVSALAASVHPAITAVQAELYDEVLRAGWYSHRPADPPRTARWGWAGLGVAVLAAAALVTWTTFGLVGCALVALGILGLTITYRVPPQTPAGAAVLGGLHALAAELHTADSTAIRPAERYQTISRVLPYAIVLGGWDRWVAALVAADDDAAPDPDDLGWYHAPASWRLADLPASLDSFITVVTGRLFTRA
ncbi:MAG: DUF2207 domain-containing protein [Propionibacteriaceae bacterium]|jgi:hypothetical protein|nr:DUF2207 domain-containing protein [Propionibacteriaceae bacterium]